MIKAELAKVGARGVDSLPFSQGGTAEQARALKMSGVDFFVGYLGDMSTQRLDYIFDAGLAFMAVTRGGNYDGTAAVGASRDLGLPAGSTVWLDLEGSAAFKTPAQELIAKIDGWAAAVAGASFEPGLYVGSPQPLTADELYRLSVVRYWKAPSRILDRNGQAWDGPACGFCMYQLWPSVNWPGNSATSLSVDVNFIQQDYRGRLPTWVVRSTEAASVPVASR